jgi:hypothetical protein
MAVVDQRGERVMIEPRCVFEGSAHLHSPKLGFGPLADAGEKGLFLTFLMEEGAGSEDNTEAAPLSSARLHYLQVPLARPLGPSSFTGLDPKDVPWDNVDTYSLDCTSSCRVAAALRDPMGAALWVGPLDGDRPDFSRITSIDTSGSSATILHLLGDELYFSEVAADGQSSSLVRATLSWHQR